jgi:thiazole synthase ThiGH ThiG subunit
MPSVEQRLGNDVNKLVIAGRSFGSRLITGTGK